MKNLPLKPGSVRHRHGNERHRSVADRWANTVALGGDWDRQPRSLPSQLSLPRRSISPSAAAGVRAHRRYCRTHSRHHRTESHPPVAPRLRPDRGWCCCTRCDSTGGSSRGRGPTPSCSRSGTECFRGTRSTWLFHPPLAAGCRREASTPARSCRNFAPTAYGLSANPLRPRTSRTQSRPRDYRPRDTRRRTSSRAVECPTCSSAWQTHC